jgi:aromatic ring hydroxylase
MRIKTRDEYLAALRELRPDIYKFGELIEDVTTHPATKRTVESHALNWSSISRIEQILSKGRSQWRRKFISRARVINIR